MFYENFNFLPQVLLDLGIKNRKICIITDDNVSKIYLSEVKSLLNTKFSDVFSYAFESGEKSKNIDTISKFYEFFLENKFDRKTVIIALGGGVVGDMAGFAAATYLRGLTFIQVPTTLLSQIDSSVGGKVGVDFLGSKNIVGAFYQPELVYINVNTLSTLNAREYSAGIAEAVKYGFILSEEFYNFVLENKGNLLEKNMDTIYKLIYDCLIFKADIVKQDEKEAGVRAFLNFGHTIGHSVETLKEFELIHGECVALGMVCALYIAKQKKFISLDDFLQFKDLLVFFKLPVKVEDLDANDIYEQLFLDKKVSENKINFILIERIGKAFVTNELTKDEFLNAISQIIF